MWFRHVSNLANLIISSVIAVIAIRYRSHYYGYNVFFNDSLALTNTLVVLSIITIIISLLKYCSLIRDDICQRTPLTILMIIVSLFEIVICAVLWSLHPPAYSFQKSILQYGFHNTAIQGDWDKLQFQFKCCGATNYTDWIKHQASTSHHIPASCCENLQTSIFECTPQNVYKQGCLHNLKHSMSDKTNKWPWQICLSLSATKSVLEFLTFILERRHDMYDTLD